MKYNNNSKNSKSVFAAGVFIIFVSIFSMLVTPLALIGCVNILLEQLALQLQVPYNFATWFSVFVIKLILSPATISASLKANK